MANKSSNIKERILQLTDFKRIAKEKFFPQIGMSYGNFKGKSKMTPLNSNAIADIFAMFPDLNLEWLITGEGPMLKSAPAAPASNDKEIIALQREIIRLQKENAALKEIKSVPAVHHRESTAELKK